MKLIIKTTNIEFISHQLNFPKELVQNRTCTDAHSREQYPLMGYSKDEYGMGIGHVDMK